MVAGGGTRSWSTAGEGHTDVVIELDELLAAETDVWVAMRDGDAVASRRALSEDFLGVSSSGCNGRDDHVGDLAEGPTVAWFDLSEEHTMSWGADVALLVYRADYRVPDAADVRTMYVSSVWERRDGRLVNVFSQDTARSDVRETP